MKNKLLHLGVKVGRYFDVHRRAAEGYLEATRALKEDTVTLVGEGVLFCGQWQGHYVTINLTGDEMDEGISLRNDKMGDEFEKVRKWKIQMGWRRNNGRGVGGKSFLW